MTKKNNYIALLEINGKRNIHLIKSVSINNVKRTIGRKIPDAIIIRIYPEPDLFL
jgi:hypothetical protein